MVVGQVWEIWKVLVVVLTNMLAALPLDLGGMYSISGTSSLSSPSTANFSTFVVSAGVAFGLGFLPETLAFLVFPRSICWVDGVWKAFALAFVVFAPRGARILGPDN